MDESSENLTGAPARQGLTFDLDVDVCVIGGGLAGLTAALESARLGASVVVLEGRSISWNASGHNLGTVMPGYGVPASDLIERVGFEDARELWTLAQDGADYVRKTAAPMPDIALTDGALDVSLVDAGDELISQLQTMGEDFGTEIEGWQVDRVREVLKTDRYFHAIHFPKAFQLDARTYVRGLAALAESAGVRIFEDTPVVSIDPAGIRKRVFTPSAKLRCTHVVLAGNAHLGAPSQRLTATLLPTWRYAVLTEPLGTQLLHTVAFRGSVIDSHGIDHFRVVDGDRLLWSSPETTWQGDPKHYVKRIQNRIAATFPELGLVSIAESWSGMFGQTVHGMPQIGEIQPGLWVLSGFGRQGLNTTAMGGQLVARSILAGDDRWRLFSPFELVWAGGPAGRIAGQAIDMWVRGHSAAAGALSRYRERAQARELAREEAREARIASAKAQASFARQQASAAMHEERRGPGT
ncbi:FAD dependent oxidoreductase [Bradyrhizobiaceae bacterium SG-6C]|nr:FAD dependent oxidoreductase [Bradyrhizobiaceae bacterium SG-6C]